MTIAFSDLSRLDVRNGHRRLTRRGATTGAAVGVLAATLPAAFLPCADGRIGIVYGCIKPVDGLAFVAASAAVGALYGGVIGTFLREPRWRTVVRR